MLYKHKKKRSRIAWSFLFAFKYCVLANSRSTVRGIEWGRPIFVAYVRESRFTKEYLEKTGEFTVNIPLTDCDKNILACCGTKSGRDMDKFAELGLTEETPETISVPGIRELPLTLECKVIYKQDQDPTAIAKENDDRYYAKGTANEGDYHTAYYGQILAAYIIE